jgi:DNA-binding winged helix-turn-helix (wHTH) protein
MLSPTFSSVNDWAIDAETGTLTHQVSNEKRRLGEFQLKLLLVLLSHAGEICPREMLINMVWKNRVIGPNSLSNAIHALRLVLGDDGKSQKIIRTIPKIGYLLSVDFCTPGEKALLESENNVEEEMLLPVTEKIHDPFFPKPGCGYKNICYTITIQYPSAKTENSDDTDSSDDQVSLRPVGCMITVLSIISYVAWVNV